MENSAVNREWNGSLFVCFIVGFFVVLSLNKLNKLVSEITVMVNKMKNEYLC